MVTFLPMGQCNVLGIMTPVRAICHDLFLGRENRKIISITNIGWFKYVYAYDS